MIVHCFALQLRHRYRIHFRRRCLTVTQELASVLTGLITTAEILAEPTSFKLHILRTFIALDDRTIVTANLKFAALDLESAAIGIIAADVQFAPFVEEITIHRGVTQPTAVLFAQ